MDLSRWHRNRAPRSPAHLRSPSTASAPDATSRQSPASPTTRRPGGAPGTRGWERGRVPGLRAGSASAARGDGPGLQEALRGLTRRCRARRVGPTSPPPLRLRGQQARLGAAHLVSKGCGSSLCTFSACLISSEVAPAFPGCCPGGTLQSSLLASAPLLCAVHPPSSSTLRRALHQATRSPGSAVRGLEVNVTDPSSNVQPPARLRLCLAHDARAWTWPCTSELDAAGIVPVALWPGQSPLRPPLPSCCLSVKLAAHGSPGPRSPWCRTGQGSSLRARSQPDSTDDRHQSTAATTGHQASGPIHLTEPGLQPARNSRGVNPSSRNTARTAAHLAAKRTVHSRPCALGSASSGSVHRARSRRARLCLGAQDPLDQGPGSPALRVGRSCRKDARSPVRQGRCPP